MRLESPDPVPSLDRREAAKYEPGNDKIVAAQRNQVSDRGERTDAWSKSAAAVQT